MSMKVKVRLFATLRENREKEIELEVLEGASTRQVAEILKIKEEEIALLLVNGVDRGLDAPLAPGDLVSLFPPVGGG